MREVALEDKHHLRKSADRKAHIRKAFIPLTTHTGLICAFRSAAEIFSGGVYPRAQPHARSLFLFPIVFGINLSHGKMTGGGPWNPTDKYTRLSADWPQSALLRSVPRQIIVHSLISGPQPFSDFFYIIKVREETVLCN